MKKCKIFIISVLALSMTVSLVLCILSVKSSPAKVSATGKTVYYINSENWSTVKIHYYGGDDGTTEDNWPYSLPAMTRVNGELYSFDIGNNTNVVFVNGDNGSKTSVISDIADGNVYRGNDPDVAFNVSGETTVYFYNADGWSDVKYHAYREEDGLYRVENTEFWSSLSAVEVGPEHPDWYKATVSNLYQYIVFHGVKDNDNRQTNNLIVAEKYYYNNGPYPSFAAIETQLQIEAMNADVGSYYLVGEYNGGAENCACSFIKGVYDGEESVRFENIGLELGGKIKVIYINAVDDWIFYPGSGIGDEDHRIVSAIDGGTGVYDISISTYSHEITLSKQSADTIFSGIKYKKSTDGKYLLFAVQFDISTLPVGAQEIGFVINGVYYDTDTYYTSIVSGDPATTILTAESGKGIIVCEIPKEEITAFAVMAYIKGSSDVILASTDFGVKTIS